ncbi:MAG: AlpA family phage regulatory protein [Hyphomicrobium sp.]
MAEVKRRTSKCRSDIYREIAKGTFPAPVKLGERASAWLEHEVAAWIAGRVAARGACRLRAPRNTKPDPAPCRGGSDG